MAFITFNHRYKGRLSQVVPATKAREIQAALNNPPDELTEEQGEFLLAIKKIYFGKPGRPEKAVEPATDHLTNPGVLQGMSEIIPRGDR